MTLRLRHLLSFGEFSIFLFRISDHFTIFHAEAEVFDVYSQFVLKPD